MTGSLQIKKDTYYMVINLYGTDGKRKPKWISTGLIAKGNKKRAEQRLRETLREYEQQEKARKPGSDMPFSAWIRHWLHNISKPRVDIVTFEGYEQTADTHVLPYFEESAIALGEVSTKVLQKYIDHKATNGRKRGEGGLSYTSLRLMRNIVNQSLKLAVSEGLIDRNPCEGLVLPKKERREVTFFSEDQILQLLGAIRDEPIYPLIHFNAMYGLRRSELLALQWDCVDFKAKQFTVRRTVVQNKTITEKEKTKNVSSRRTLPLTPELLAMLDRLKKEEARNRRLLGAEYVENQLVFKWPDGRPYQPQYVAIKFSRLLAKHGFPHIRFHDLRHSCASMLIANGFNLKDVQDWLGHANISMTADIYGHLDMKRKRSMADSIAGKFGGMC